VSLVADINLALELEVSRFLYAEAALLDEWRLDEWGELFASDGWYLVPPLDIDDPETASHAEVMFLIADSRSHLKERIRRMTGTAAFAEHPRSRTVHMISNVFVREASAERVLVSCTQQTFRSRYHETVAYFGRTYYELRRQGGTFKIAEKRICLAVESLTPIGSIPILL
jgi:p-cumate 2,3-dioxygenase subunit beta